MLERVVSQAQSARPLDHLSPRGFRNAGSVPIESAAALFGEKRGWYHEPFSTSTQSFRSNIGDSTSTATSRRPCRVPSRLLHQQIEEPRQCRTSSTYRSLCRACAPPPKSRAWPSPVCPFHWPSHLLPSVRLSRDHHHRFYCRWYCCCLQGCGFEGGDLIPSTLTTVAQGQSWWGRVLHFGGSAAYSQQQKRRCLAGYAMMPRRPLPFARVV